MFFQDKAKSLDVTQVACGSSHVILRSSKDYHYNTQTYHTTGKGQLYSMGTGTEVSSIPSSNMLHTKCIKYVVFTCLNELMKLKGFIFLFQLYSDCC